MQPNKRNFAEYAIAVPRFLGGFPFWIYEYGLIKISYRVPSRFPWKLLLVHDGKELREWIAETLKLLLSATY